MAVFILWLVAAPFVSMFVHSFQACIAAGEETQSLHLMQGILETILDPSATPAATGGFVTHPAWPRYEYRIMVQPHSGVFLDRVTVELRDTGRPGQVISFTTLKARRKLYETASFQ
ncbi:MAG TPA: hypothetical protein GXX34_09515 [Clostridia bacterium]|nr:hypothetical protein [Clostridia bacterium]